MVKRNVPRRFVGARVADFGEQTETVPAAALEFLERIQNAPRRIDVGGKTDETVANLNGVDGLVVVGPVGSGKTHLACAIANALPTDVEGTFTSALDVVEEEKQRIRRREEGQQPGGAHELGRFPGVLILDDLTGVRPTEFALDSLSSIIRTRYDRMLCTVVTTHSGYEDVSELYGSAIASRIYEMGPTVKMPERNRRLRKGGS